MKTPKKNKKSTVKTKNKKKTRVKTKKQATKNKASVVTIAVPATVVPETGRKRKPNYLNNRDLLTQVALSKKQGKMTNELALMLQTLCARYGRRGNFVNYTYNEDMQAFAMLMLVKTWQAFNPEKSNNPFAFFTQCVKNSFIQFLKQEKKQRDVRDELMVNSGLTPSFSYTAAHENKDEEFAIEDLDPVINDSSDSETETLTDANTDIIQPHEYEQEIDVDHVEVDLDAHDEGANTEDHTHHYD